MSEQFHTERVVVVKEPHEQVVIASHENGEHREVVVDRGLTYEQRQEVVHNERLERWQLWDKSTQVVWFLTGILEVILGLRLVLRLLAANPNAGFAQLIYGLSDPFLIPFRNLVTAPAADGSVFEVSTLIAMAVYALLAYAATRLLTMVLDTHDTRSVKTVRRQIS